MKKYHKLFLFIGIFLIVSFILAAAALFAFAKMSCPTDTAIIGGADKPTFIFLMSQFRLPSIILVAELLEGSGCIIASIIMKKKK